MISATARTPSSTKSSFYRFAGIRKLISVAADDGVADGGLPSGVEVTYSVMAVDTLDHVQRLARGYAIDVLYQE